MSRPLIKVALAGMIVLAFTACSQPTAGPQAAPTVTVTAPAPTVTVTVTPEPSPSAKVVVDAEYESVEDLRDAYVAIGYGCSNWEQDDKVLHASESGSCDSETVLSVFVDQDDVESQVQSWKDFYKEMGSDQEAYLIVGPNWIINTADQRTAGVQMQLGGEIVTNQD